jgi:hypothetical protein
MLSERLRLEKQSAEDAAKVVAYLQAAGGQ